MDIKPIKSEADHEAALTKIDGLMDAGADTIEGDRLEILVTLVEAYEAEHFPIEAPDPVEAITFRMEQMGMTRKDVEPLIGSRARVSEVLSGRRRLSLAMIRRLTAVLKIPAEVLIQDTTARRLQI